MRVIIGIGIPGCGKTTILKPYAERTNAAYINADDIRLELTGDPSNHTREQDVWRLAHDRIRQALLTRDVIIDATHSRRSDRVRMAQFCRDNGAHEVIGYWLRLPLEVCQARNAARERKVPNQALQAMQNRLDQTPPATDEGFDTIIVYPAELPES